MIQDFKQAYISPVLKEYFGEDFLTKYSLDWYNDIFSPSIFFGLYLKEDISYMAEHKGPKIIIWGGNDMNPEIFRYVADLQKTQPIYTWYPEGDISNMIESYGIQLKRINVALKDYSLYTPTPLGENIYVYKGILGNRSDYFQWEETITPLIEVFGQDRIIYTDNVSSLELIETMYKNCFVYVKPNPKGGCTTMWELGHMGRKTLGVGMKESKFFTNYSSINNLIELIVEESKNIGKFQSKVAQATKNSFIGHEWLTLNFWDKKYETRKNY